MSAADDHVRREPLAPQARALTLGVGVALAAQGVLLVPLAVQGAVVALAMDPPVPGATSRALVLGAVGGLALALGVALARGVRWARFLVGGLSALLLVRAVSALLVGEELFPATLLVLGWSIVGLGPLLPVAGRVRPGLFAEHAYVAAVSWGSLAVAALEVLPAFRKMWAETGFTLPAPTELLLEVYFFLFETPAAFLVPCALVLGPAALLGRDGRGVRLAVHVVGVLLLAFVGLAITLPLHQLHQKL